MPALLDPALSVLAAESYILFMNVHACCRVGYVILLLCDLFCNYIHGVPRTRAASAGMRLRYVERGSGDCVVLLLHDIGESAEVWDSIAEDLVEEGVYRFPTQPRTLVWHCA